MKPLVSVIIPSYNSAKYLLEAVDSVLNQTYKDYEIIIVDDGSTDNTKQILDEYLQERGFEISHRVTESPSHQVTKSQGHKDTRAQEKTGDEVKWCRSDVCVRYIYQENKGPAAARNRGIKDARGEYIAFLDSDDIWLPEKLEKQIEFFSNNEEIGLVFGGRIDFSEEDSEGKLRFKKFFIDNDMFLNIWWDNPITTSTVVVKSRCFRQVGLFDESKEVATSEDREMWLRITQYYKAEFVPQLLVKYRIRKDGYNRSNINRSYASSKVVIDRYWPFVQKKGFGKNYYKKRLYRFYFNYGLSLLSIDDFKHAHVCFRKALRYNSVNLKVIVYFLATLLSRDKIRLLKQIKKRIS